MNDHRDVNEGGGLTHYGYDRIGRVTQVSKGLKYAQFDDEINRAVKANRGVDRFSNQGNNPAHYMPNYGDDAEKLINDQLQRAKSLKKSGKMDEAMDALGEGLHTLQDKYPHKDNGSWVNHAKGLLPFVSSPDDYIGTPKGNAYKDTCNYIDKFLRK